MGARSRGRPPEQQSQLDESREDCSRLRRQHLQA
jgi:hypothetical protein